MADNSVLNRLQQLFGIAVKKPKDESPKPVPAQTDPDSGKLKPIKMPSQVSQYYDYWLNSTYDSYSTLQERFERYKDLQFCVLNSGILAFAYELYAQETLNADEQNEVIGVTASQKKIEKYIREFFNRIQVNVQNLRPTSNDLSLYGDHFWVLSTDEKLGVTGFTPVDVTTVKDRIEFNAANVQKMLTKNKLAYTNLLSRETRLQRLAQILSDVKQGGDLAAFYQNYLFGFSMDDGIVLPPWSVLHFRRYDASNEFHPFGKSLFLYSIARFRQLKAAENLLALGRAAQFPREVYEVVVDEAMTEAEKFEAVNDVREEYSNAMAEAAGPENIGVGGAIWTIKGLVEYSSHESRVDLGNVTDVEMIRDDLILSTGIPRGYIDPNKGSFGTSGQSLLQQYKPFARKVYNNQSAILNELVQLVRLQFALTGDYPVDTEFELTMNFPVIEESSDRIRVKNDTLRLAKDTIDNLGQAVGLDRGEALPKDVVKSIFQKLSFIDNDDLEMWIDEIGAEEEELTEALSGLSEKERASLKDRRNRTYKKAREAGEDVLREAYFKAKRDQNLNEGVLSNKHYLTSSCMDHSQKAILQIIGEKKAGKLEERIESEEIWFNLKD